MVDSLHAARERLRTQIRHWSLLGNRNQVMESAAALTLLNRVAEDWEEEAHPRGGSKNRGQFARKGTVSNKLYATIRGVKHEVQKGKDGSWEFRKPGKQFWIKSSGETNAEIDRQAGAKPEPINTEVDHDQDTERLEPVGEGGEGGRLPTRQQMGDDAPGLPEDEQAGAGPGAGSERGVPGLPDDGGLRRDDAGPTPGSGGDADGERAGTGPGAALPGERVDQPNTRIMAAVLNQRPTPETPTDLSAGNWSYQSRDFFKGGLKAKFRANVEALQALRTMQVEGRDRATPAEQEKMSKFVGWGQFPALFNDYAMSYEERNAREKAQGEAEGRTYNAKDWTKEQEELKALLSPEEWEAARKSTINGHFTHPDVVDAHWKMAEKLGYKGGRFLETSAGIGYYLGMMPAHLAGNTRSAAVELDTGTGELLKAMYPATHVEVTGFEKYLAPDGYYDLVASNVPFAKEGVHDPKYNKFNASLHDYFFLKSADLTKPGGLIMHITSTGTMDKGNNNVRQELMNSCELVAAYRLPGDTHLENAGTSVVTDMLILRKKIPGQEPVPMDVEATAEALRQHPEAAPKREGFTGITTDSLGRLYHWVDGIRVPGPKWDKVVTMPDPDGGAPIPINEYFADHPENILGRLDRSGTMYTGESLNVSLATPEEVSEALGRRVDVVVDPDSTKRQWVFMDNGERVPASELRRVGAEIFQARMQGAIDRLPEGVIHTDQGSKEAFQPERLPAPGEVKDGGFTIKDGKLFRREGGALVAQKCTEANLERIAGMLAIRDAERAIINEEVAGRDASEQRAELNRIYDKFVEEHGALNLRANALAMRGDPDSFMLRALEKWDAKEEVAVKADIFSRSTVSADHEITSASNVSDGLQASLHKFGRVDIDHVASLMGANPDDVKFAMIDQGIAFQDPKAGWKPADEYLSGNVRRKLLEAKAAAAVDPQFLPNVEALEKVQPEDVDYTQITPKLGAPWIPPGDIAAFAAELMESHGTPIEVSYTAETATWHVSWTKEGKRLYANSPQANEVWGINAGNGRGADTVDCLLAAMSNKSITIKGGIDRFEDEHGQVHEFPAVDEQGEPVVNRSATADANAKVQEMRDKFKDWIWEDDARTERLTRYYNDNFNNIRDMKYNGQHQTFPGMDPMLRDNLFPHIKDFVWQVVTTGNGLAAHEVGTGKTYAMIASAMELRRLGLAKKPCIACLKANIEQITADVLKLYPKAKILSTAGLYKAEERQATIARMATGDYDIVLMTHDQLNLLKMSPEVEAKYIREELAELEAAKLAAWNENPKKDNKIVKQLEKAKDKLLEKLQKALSTETKDDALTFEQTGIDQIFVDEAHNYKSLPVITKANRIKGIPTGRSQRATTMLMRTRWLQEHNGGRGVVFATGTPISNTLAELFTMQRYLQYNELKERGIHHFDAWVNTFGEIITKPEFTVAGTYKPTTRLSAYTNIPELMHITREAMDVVRADTVKRPDGTNAIKRPTRKDIAIKSPNNKAMQDLMASLADRAEAISHRGGPPQPGDDNMLVICTDGRKGAVDMRLLDDNAPDDPNSKTNLAVKQVLELHKQNPNGAQIIFSDVGVHAMKERTPSSDAKGYDFAKGEAIGEDDDLAKITGGEDFAEADLGAKGRFRLYDDIIDKLVAGGIPRDQIADFSKLEGAKKDAAMAAMRRGEIKVAIGSTQKLGTGCNVQDKLMALHHLDVPWVPASVEQRDGRGWRTGNTNEKVEIYRYVAEGSLDQKFWDIIATKANFQDQVLANRESNIRTMADDDTEVLTAEQLRAEASGDLREVERVNLAEEVKTLRAAKVRHERDQRKLEANLEKLKTEVPEMETQVQRYEQDMQHLEKRPDFEFKADGRTIRERKEAEDALNAKVTEARKAYANLDTYERRYYQPELLGEYKGMRVYFDPANSRAGATIEGQSGKTYDAAPSLGSIEYVSRNLKTHRDQLQKFLDAGRKQMESGTANLGKRFQKLQELEEKAARLKALTEELTAPKAQESLAQAGRLVRQIHYWSETDGQHFHGKILEAAAELEALLGS